MGNNWQSWMKTTWSVPVCQQGCFQTVTRVNASAAAYREADASLWQEGNGASFHEILAMAGFHLPVHSSFSLAPAWCFHRTLHLLLTSIVFSNLETLSNHCFCLKKKYVLSKPKYFWVYSEQGQVTNKLLLSLSWKVLLWEESQDFSYSRAGLR